MRDQTSDHQPNKQFGNITIPLCLAGLFVLFLVTFSYLFFKDQFWMLVLGVAPLSVLVILLAYHLPLKASAVNEKQLRSTVDILQSEVHELTQQLSATEDDLSQRKESLIQTEKLASLGQLAAGVAHEINNPVGFMMSNMCTLKEYIYFLDQLCKHLLELLSGLSKQEKLNHEDVIRKIESTLKIEDLEFVLSDANALIDESLSGGSRIKEITNSMNGFVKQSHEEKEVSVNDLIENTLNIVWNQIKYSCTIEKHLNSEMLVKIVPNAFDQVLLNILVNASHAMDGLNGVLTIRTYESEDSVFIEIADTGTGIEKENLKKIFDPFYTTKPVGQGTGLGMSISYEIVTAAGGSIEVNSELGKGTCFKIRLPALPAE
jgi:two-component system, NtrC family, sensor kinase